MKLVIVGQAPGRGAGRPLGPEGRSGRRLLELAGMSYEELSSRIGLINLGAVYAGKAGKGDRLPDVPAKRLRLISELIQKDDVRFICLGRWPARVLVGPWTRELPFLRWSNGLAIMPHPSGIVRWWNDPANVRAARRFLRRALREAV